VTGTLSELAGQPLIEVRYKRRELLAGIGGRQRLFLDVFLGRTRSSASRITASCVMVSVVRADLIRKGQKGQKFQKFQKVSYRFFNMMWIDGFQLVLFLAVCCN
jgi:hypothetical protein